MNNDDMRRALLFLLIGGVGGYFVRGIVENLGKQSATPTLTPQQQAAVQAQVQQYLQNATPVPAQRT